jgi:plasmid stabilization system protein ParE
MKRIEFHPEADEELVEALDWYRDRSEVASQAFALEVANAIASIAEAPERWPVSERGTRSKVLQRFPCTILNRYRADSIYVTAVAHHKRRPGYWKKRE